MSNQGANNTVYSVYIPKIYKGRGFEKIGSVFFELRVGRVTRVDFVPFKNKRDSGNYRSAFVYFTKLYTDKPNHIIDAIESKGRYLLNLDANIAVSKYTDSEYWELLKNKKPFEETTTNIHQLAHNMKIMEEKMTKIEETNKILTEENQKLRKEIELLKATMENNVEPTLCDLHCNLDATQYKISRLQRTSSKLIEQIFEDEPSKISLNNDMLYGIPYAKRLLKDETDYGDSDNETLDREKITQDNAN
uniref:Uncharacterized protein n=1 Tax=viral metagenome TaxID=1070528 RepID=A0A6C0IG31_9ZZZZ